MTLLITVFAAVISTLTWYLTIQKTDLKLGMLCLMYWGAALMWLADAVSEYAELGAQYFIPSGGDMLNDAFLGLSAAALGLVIWLVRLLVSDPRGVIADALLRKKRQKEFCVGE